jgi:hypothetical protein
MRPFVLSSTLFLIMAFAVAGAQEQTSVKFHVTDNIGNKISPVSIVLEHEGKVMQAQEDTPTVLNYGGYLVTLRVPGFRTSEYLVTVDQPNQIVSLAMRLGGFEGPDPTCSVTGIVPVAGVARIRLMAVFSQYLVDVAVSDSGKYLFRGLECGYYVLTVMSQKECLTSITLPIGGVETKVVDLAFEGTEHKGCPILK